MPSSVEATGGLSGSFSEISARKEFSCAASSTNRGGADFSSTLAAKLCSLASYASGSINRTEGGSFKLDSASGSNLDFMSDDLKLDGLPPTTMDRTAE
jgi:hypothetical protein